jgi:NitT/TauT family transport system ATP-binding protein
MIEVKDLTKSFKGKTIYDHFSISFEDNKITGIIGPSGCGKTTLLRIISGLEPFEQGSVQGIAYLFQEDRLLPWFNVYQNIELVLKAKMNKEESKERIEHVLKLLNLYDARELKPSELSGGMQRRVAIGRALAYDSDVILLDEPFKGLDEKLKNEIFEELEMIWAEKHKTIILVTHDLSDAYRLSDKIYEFDGCPVQCKKL